VEEREDRRGEDQELVRGVEKERATVAESQVDG